MINDFIYGIFKKLSKKWQSFFTFWPLTYLTPLSSLGTFLLICFQMLWSFIFIHYEIGQNITYSTTGVFAILSATLGFILPLQLNTALEKNSGCLDNYNTFVNNIVAFAMDILSFHVVNEKNELLNSDELKLAEVVLAQTFDVIIAMPALAKWHFRNGKSDLNKLTTKNNVKFSNTRGGYEVVEISQHVSEMAHVEACFFKLLDYVKDLKENKTQIAILATIQSWERAYSSWDNMGNLNKYKSPMIFQYVVNSALIFYSFLLPYEFYENGYNAIWMAGSIGYFFLGLNVAGHRARNPFASGKRNFQTVTNAQKRGTKQLQQIWNSREIIFKSSKHRHEIFETNAKKKKKKNNTNIVKDLLLGNPHYYQKNILNY